MKYDSFYWFFSSTDHQYRWENSIVLDQGKMYAIKIFKSTPLFIFKNLGIPEQMNWIIMNYSFKIKVIQG